MKNNKIILIIPALLLWIFAPGPLYAQGIKINPGAVFKTIGPASVIVREGNLVNNGTFQSSLSTTVTMKGTSACSIGGSSPAVLGNLRLDNPGGLSLNNSESVNGTLTFIQGKIILGGNDLIMGPSASISGSGSSRYIVTEGIGALRQRVMNNATDVTYPVGLAEEYLPVTIQLTAGSVADDISARVANGLYSAYDENNVPSGSPLTSHAVQKTWFLDENIDGQSDATVKVQWNAAGEAPGFDRSSCDLGRFYGNSWVYSPALPSAGTGPFTQTLSGISVFSPVGVFSSQINCSLTGNIFCASSPVQVSYSLSGAAWNDENLFTAQLSDATGSFTSPVEIGSVSSQGAGTINALLPANSTDGTAYRVRVVSSNPSFSGDDNGTDLAIHQLRSFSGNFSYYNAENTPLISGIRVKLYQDGIQAGPELTVTDGTFSYSDLCPGVYELRITSDAPTEGSVNATDAAQVNYWGVHPYTIEKVRFYAGDVTGESFFINSADAQLIKANFVSGAPFNKGGSWTFWKAGESISSNSSPAESWPLITLPVGSNASSVFYGLCTGDFNRSFDPDLARSAGQNLALLYTGSRQAGQNQELELPVKILNTSAIGAISLILEYPSDLAEILDVRMVNGEEGLEWKAKNNELRIGWNSQYPVYPEAGTTLLVLKLRTSQAFTGEQPIRFMLTDDPQNELADDQYYVLDNAGLGMDIVETSPAGIDEQLPGGGLVFGSYPNPFCDLTTFRYSLPSDGRVTLEISPVMGNFKTVLLNEMQNAGDHSVKYDPVGLDPGLYLVTLRFSTKDNLLVRTIKIMITGK